MLPTKSLSRYPLVVIKALNTGMTLIHSFRYGQYQHKLVELAEEAKLLKAYSSYSVFSHTLLYTLFRTWVQQTTSEMKPYLALPTQAEAELFMAELKKKSPPAGGKSAAPPDNYNARGPRGDSAEQRQGLFKKQ